MSVFEIIGVCVVLFYFVMEAFLLARRVAERPLRPEQAWGLLVFIISASLIVVLGKLVGIPVWIMAFPSIIAGHMVEDEFEERVLQRQQVKQ